jgi:putative aldouronate transport system permease protein
MGSMMSLGFQKIFLLQNAFNLDTSEVISTYVYKTGLLSSRQQFSYSTAISLLNTAVNVVLLLSANKISKKLSETSLF